MLGLLCAFSFIEMHSAETELEQHLITALFIGKHRGQKIVVAGDVDGRVGAWYADGGNILFKDDPHQKMSHVVHEDDLEDQEYPSSRIIKSIRPDRQRRVTDIAQQDNIIFAATSNGIIRLYDLDNSPYKFIGYINCNVSPHFYSNTRSVASQKDPNWGRDPLFVYDVSDEYSRQFWEMEVDCARHDETVSLEVLRNNSLLVGLGWDHRKYLFNCRDNFSKRAVALQGVTHGVCGLTGHEDGFFVGYSDGTIHSVDLVASHHDQIANICEFQGGNPHKKIFLKTVCDDSLLVAAWQDYGVVHVIDIKNRSLLFGEQSLLVSVAGNKVYFTDEATCTVRKRSNRGRQKKSYVLNELDLETIELNKFALGKPISAMEFDEQGLVLYSSTHGSSDVSFGSLSRCDVFQKDNAGSVNLKGISEGVEADSRESKLRRLTVKIQGMLLEDDE